MHKITMVAMFTLVLIIFTSCAFRYGVACGAIVGVTATPQNCKAK
jgi:hypothetical protein